MSDQDETCSRAIASWRGYSRSAAASSSGSIPTARLTRPGGRVIVYTINKWSPVPIITYLVPFRFHHLPKRLLWNSNQRDTFPVAYRMNTRSALCQVFGAHGFQESEFTYLDDCRTFAAFRALLILELCVWRGLRG